jgi:hypothetical protein
MWAAGLRFFVAGAVVAAIGLGVAAVWAVARGGGSHAFLTACLVIGVFVAVFGVMGHQAPIHTEGRIPGMRAFRGDEMLPVRPGAIFVLAGVVLLVIGAFGRG